jgi:hypothetical protein
MLSFYALMFSAECRGIQILTIRYFNSLQFFWVTLHNDVVIKTDLESIDYSRTSRRLK